MAHGFSEVQLLHISEMIRTALATEGGAQIQRAVIAGGTALESQTAEFLQRLDTYHTKQSIGHTERSDALQKKHEEMLANQAEIVRIITDQKKVVDEALGKHNAIEQDLDLKQAAFVRLSEQMAQQENYKVEIIAELNKRQSEMEGFKSVIEAVSIETQNTMNDVS